MTSQTLRELERSYRQERAEILADETRSWEKKMVAVRDLFAEFARRKEELLGEEKSS
jgi:hypothetical protein